MIKRVLLLLVVMLPSAVLLNTYQMTIYTGQTKSASNKYLSMGATIFVHKSNNVKSEKIGIRDSEILTENITTIGWAPRNTNIFGASDARKIRIAYLYGRTYIVGILYRSQNATTVLFTFKYYSINFSSPTISKYESIPNIVYIGNYTFSANLSSDPRFADFDITVINESSSYFLYLAYAWSFQENVSGDMYWRSNITIVKSNITDGQISAWSKVFSHLHNEQYKGEDANHQILKINLGKLRTGSQEEAICIYSRDLSAPTDFFGELIWVYKTYITYVRNDTLHDYVLFDETMPDLSNIEIADEFIFGVGSHERRDRTAHTMYLYVINTASNSFALNGIVWNDSHIRNLLGTGGAYRDVSLALQGKNEDNYTFIVVFVVSTDIGDFLCYGYIWVDLGSKSFGGYVADVISGVVSPTSLIRIASYSELNDPTSSDTDKDGLLDGEEKTWGTDPTNRDTDGDRLSDSEEVRKYGTNPLSADSDGDGVNDYTEVIMHTNPLSSDTDGDGIPDRFDPLPTTNNLHIIIAAVVVLIFVEMYHFGYFRNWRRDILAVGLADSGGTLMLFIPEEFAERIRDPGLAASGLMAILEIRNEISGAEQRSIFLSGKPTIFVDKGRYGYLYVFLRRGYRRIYRKIVGLHNQIEERFGEILESWSGLIDELEPIREFIIEKTGLGT